MGLREGPAHRKCSARWQLLSLLPSLIPLPLPLHLTIPLPLLPIPSPSLPTLPLLPSTAQNCARRREAESVCPQRGCWGGEDVHVWNEARHTTLGGGGVCVQVTGRLVSPQLRQRRAGSCGFRAQTAALGLGSPVHAALLSGVTCPLGPAPLGPEAWLGSPGHSLRP